MSSMSDLVFTAGDSDDPLGCYSHLKKLAGDLVMMHMKTAPQ